MRRFYFNVINKGGSAIDRDGMLMTSPDDARRHARIIMAKIIFEAIAEGKNECVVTIAIYDDRSQLVESLRSKTQITSLRSILR